MKLLCLVVVASLGCSGKKDSDKAAPPPPPKVIDAGADQECSEQVASLTDWMRKLVGEGHREVIATGVNLVTLDQAPAPIPHGLVVMVHPNMVVINGELVSDPSKTKGVELSKQFIEKASTGGDPGVVFLIDQTTPWSTVAALVNAAPAAKRERATFVFVAGTASTVEPPGPSAIDAALADLMKPIDPAMKQKPLLRPDDGGLPATVFKDCPTVTELLPTLAELNQSTRDATIADALPKAIEACGCKVELASVRRLMWAWWGRDQGAPLVGITVEIAKTAKDGSKVSAKPKAPWSDAYKAIADAADAGKPLVLQ